jgi:hypothetical protein
VKDRAENEYAVKFINDRWHILDWGPMGWRTQASKYFHKKEREYLGLGWYAKSDPEHLDYTPLDIPTTDTKGKRKAES